MVSVDAQKHVKPLAVKQSEPSSFDILKYKTLNKYTYYESGPDYIKVELSELAGVTSQEIISVDFLNRALTVRVENFKGANYQFTVPKL